MATSTTDESRCNLVSAQMAEVRRTVATAAFEQVRPGRWRHINSNVEVETGYTRGEGRLRFYKGTSRTPYESTTLLGRPGDLETFRLLAAFPNAVVIKRRSTPN